MALPDSSAAAPNPLAHTPMCRTVYYNITPLFATSAENKTEEDKKHTRYKETESHIKHAHKK